MKFTEIKSNSILSNNFILKPNYHMNYGKKRIESSAYKGLRFDTLSNVTASIFTGGIFKRVFVEDKEYGYPYISATHMMNTNPLDVAKLISKKYTPRLEEMTLKTNQILVSCAGTVGNVRLITSDLSHVVGSQDIIRVDSYNTKMPYGYIYAYLASKTAYNFMQSYIYGSVVPRIEPKTLGNLPVPILPEEKQQQIHQLIVDSTNLRVEANKLLKEAQSTLIAKLDLEERVNTNISNNIKLSAIKRSHQVRFESSFYTSKGSKLKETIVNQNDCILLGELSERIFRPGIFKRNYVSNGIDFLGGSDITKSIPDSEKKLSPTKTSNINELKLEEDWILVTCGGTIGTSVYVNNYLSKKLASQHILRVVPNKVLNGYLFAFLSSDVGVEIVKSFTYGSVIPQIEPHHLEKIPIPIIDEKLIEEINLDVISYKNKIDEAILKENQAINLIENEIDVWQ